jgi:hypothetical protein
MGMYNVPVDDERAVSDHQLGHLNSDHKQLNSLNASNPLLHLNKFKHEWYRKRNRRLINVERKKEKERNCECCLNKEQDDIIW